MLSKVDDHTIACRIADITYLPVPADVRQTQVGLISIELPQTVRAGDVFRVDVRQYLTATLRPDNELPGPRLLGKFIGAFQLNIPVGVPDELIPREVRKLAVLRYIAGAIPAGDRWSAVFARYLAQLEAKLSGLGVDPSTVPASLDDPQGPELTCVTGKVAQVSYDRHGEFNGFVLDENGVGHHFSSCERGIERVVRRACRDRCTLTVCRRGPAIHRITIECACRH
jgi:hypothetical protein